MSERQLLCVWQRAAAALLSWVLLLSGWHGRTTALSRRLFLPTRWHCLSFTVYVHISQSRWLLTTVCSQVRPSTSARLGASNKRYVRPAFFAQFLWPPCRNRALPVIFATRVVSSRRHHVSLSPNPSLLNVCAGPLGSFCSGEQNIVQTRCPKGMFCPQNAMQEPIPCPQGTFCSQSGLSRPFPCLLVLICAVSPCTGPRGYFCPSAGMPGPIACSPGFFCPQQGAVSQTSCPPGAFCSNSTASNFAICKFLLDKLSLRSFMFVGSRGRYCPDFQKCLALSLSTGVLLPRKQYVVADSVPNRPILPPIFSHSRARMCACFHYIASIVCGRPRGLVLPVAEFDLSEQLSTRHLLPS